MIERRFISLLSVGVLLLHCTQAQTYFESVGGGVDKEVRYLSLNGDSSALLATGKFVYTLADSLRANTVAQWDGTAWEVAPFAGGNGDTSLNGNGSVNFTIQDFHDTLFVSFFNDVWQYEEILSGTYLANGVWHPCVNALTPQFFLKENGRLFTGSQVDTTNGDSLHGVHEWIGGRFQQPPNSPFVSGSKIWGSAYWRDQYYFAGLFLALGSYRIIAYDGDTTWSPLGGGIVGSHLNTVEGMGDSLYVGGFFHEPSDHIAIWDGDQWHPFFPEVEYIGQVTALKSYEGSLYIKGVYHFVGDTTLYGILRWDGHSLCALGGPFGSDSGAAFEVFQGELYTGMAPSYTPLYPQNIAKLPLENIVPFACVVPSLVSTHENEAISGELSIFPNPATSSVNISYPGSAVGQRIELTNALGQLVVSETVAGFTTQISLAGVAPGVYQVTAFSQEGRYFGRVLVE